MQQSWLVLIQSGLWLPGPQAHPTYWFAGSLVCRRPGPRPTDPPAHWSPTYWSTGSLVCRLTGPQAYRSPPSPGGYVQKNVVYRISALAKFGH